MRCTSCDTQKADLQAKKSRLKTDMMLYLCGDCLKSKMEPRFLIVLVGRQKGTEFVAEYIANHRYVGDPILAREVVVKRN